MNSFWPVLQLVVGAYVLFVIFLFFTQSSLVYYPNIPTRSLVATPDSIGIAYESVTISANDGIKLHGWYIRAQQSDGVLLFLHGNAGNISHRLDSIKIFNELGFDIFIFDYRGYGKSEGKPSEEGTYRDADAAWTYLTQQRNVVPQDIVIFGRSLGASIASYLASRHTPRALIIESAFTSVPDLAAQLYPLVPVRWIARLQYNTKTFLQAVKIPVLVIHSRDDEIIPFEHAERLFSNANDPKQLLTLRGGHNDGFLVSGQQYINGLKDFLSEH